MRKGQKPYPLCLKCGRQMRPDTGRKESRLPGMCVDCYVSSGKMSKPPKETARDIEYKRQLKLQPRMR